MLIIMRPIIHLNLHPIAYDIVCHRSSSACVTYSSPFTRITVLNKLHKKKKMATKTTTNKPFRIDRFSHRRPSIVVLPYFYILRNTSTKLHPKFIVYVDGRELYKWDVWNVSAEFARDNKPLGKCTHWHKRQSKVAEGLEASNLQTLSLRQRRTIPAVGM